MANQVTQRQGDCMKLIILSQFFWDQRVVGSHRWREMARYLSPGRNVVIISADERDPECDLQIDSHRVEQGILRTEVSQGFLPLRPRGVLRSKTLGLFRDIVYPVDRHIRWARRCVALASSLADDGADDVLVTSGPPFSLHVAACQAKRSRQWRGRWIMDLRDPWTNDPGVLRARKSPKALWRREVRIEQACHNTADAVLTVGDTMARMVNRDFGSCPEVVYNGFIAVSRVAEDRPTTLEPAIRYFGRIVLGLYNPQLVFDAARECRDHLGPTTFEFWTDQKDYVLNLAARCGIPDRVAVHGHVDRRHVKELQEGASANLVLNATQRSGDHVLTGKLFELLQAKRPIIAITGRNSDMANILRNCGIPNVVEDLATAISVLRMASEGSLPAPNDGAMRFTREAAATRVNEIIDRLVSQKGS